MNIHTILIALGCAAALLVLAWLRGAKRNAWRTLQARYPSATPVAGPEHRLRWCWFGTRVQPYNNCFRAQLSEAGIRVHGIGPFGWLRKPVLLPWSSVRALVPAGAFSLDSHELRLDLDGLEAGLVFPPQALPDLAQHGVVPQAA